MEYLNDVTAASMNDICDRARENLDTGFAPYFSIVTIAVIYGHLRMVTIDCDHHR